MNSQQFALAEIYRLLANLIRPGAITELDETTARVKVRVAGIISGWLPWVTARAGLTATWSPPRPGEQVLILSPYGDLAQAVVLPAIYQDKYPAPGDSRQIDRMVFPDGTLAQYDSESHTLMISVANTGSVVIECKEASIHGDARVVGNLKVSGNITADGDVKVGGIGLKTHTHGGVMSGTSSTSPPNGGVAA